jgi:hypothetical protein
MENMMSVFKEREIGDIEKVRTMYRKNPGFSEKGAW